MSISNLLRLSYSLTILAALFMFLPGCGGDGSQNLGPSGEVEPAPILNPAPEALEPEEDFDYRINQ
jgi:hypothetical protein